jgi:hypothetical protein
MSRLNGRRDWRNRILRGLPNTPRLTTVRFHLPDGPTLAHSAKTTIMPPFCSQFVPRVVIPSMNLLLIAVPEPLRGAPTRAGFAVGRRVAAKKSLYRHTTCMSAVFVEKDSHSLHESVDFLKLRAKVASGSRENLDSLVTQTRWPADRPTAGRQAGLNHGAARNGNRKRTRVRVACGGGIRPRSLGHQPIHGHFGLSVVGRETLSPVVYLPACELRVRQRHFSRGPGLLAALTARTTSVARLSAYERQPAHHQTVWATRPAGCTVIRAASVLKDPPERPAAGRKAHQPSPRTRLRLG